MGVVEDRKGSRTERPRNPLPCPVLAQPELRCPWEMKMTANTLRGVLRPTSAQLPLPSLPPIPLELAGPRGSGRGPQTLATLPPASRRFRLKLRRDSEPQSTLGEGRETFPLGARGGVSRKGDSTLRPLGEAVASASRSQIKASGLHPAGRCQAVEPPPGGST